MAKQKKIKAISLFSSAGIDEYYLDDIGISVCGANELVSDRANLYSKLYENSKMFQGDINDKKIFNDLVNHAKKNKVSLVLATPPCQGVSLIGKNKDEASKLLDKRNFLIFKLIDFIKIVKPKFVLIENVPTYLNLKLPHKNLLKGIIEILNYEFSSDYQIEYKVLNTKDYGVPQDRKRVIIKLYKHGLKWPWPKEEKIITLKEAIGHLPSLESEELSDIEWHYARKHSEKNILWMKNTPEGRSAFENKKHYPAHIDGRKIKGFSACYSRMSWDKPCPTVTMRNDCIASQRNVHPGRKRKDGTYSDARVLTILELLLVSSLPEKNNIPKDTPELLIRRCLGECVPPLFIKKICQKINK